MPNRVIRAGILSSETVCALHDRTHRLYVALLLIADDYGLVDVSYGSIRQATALLDWSRESVAKMLGELVDAGLILPYEVDGRRYAAIARWESSINSRAPKYPVPSWGMAHVRRVYAYKDAATRIAASRYINHLAFASGAPVVDQQPTRSPPVYEEGRGKREKKRQRGEVQWPCPDGIDAAAWRDWMQVRRRKKASDSGRALTAVMAKIEQARKLGLDPSAIVGRSADSGWTDLYLPDPVRSHAQSSGQSRPALQGDLGLLDTVLGRHGR